MFTGIIEDTGEVRYAGFSGGDGVFKISPNRIDTDELVAGESISVNGVCLTVTKKGSSDFTVDVSRETLSRTNLSSFTTGSRINLERSLKAGDRMGGHIVTGHIDGVGTVDSIAKAGDSVEFWFLLPESLSKYMIQKGSVAVDGVSLTVNSVEGNRFSVNIIPHTQKETVFSDYSTGHIVNIECDIIGKYVEKFVLLRDEKEDTDYNILRKL